MTMHPDVTREHLTDPDTERAVMRTAWLTLSVVGLASMVSGMSGSALNVALPTVVRHFDASTAAASWILLAYMLTNTVLLLAFGRMADMFGRRSMYLTGLSLYTVASILSGLAPNAWFLVGFRIIQAIGGAMLLTNSAALVTAAFPRHRLGEGMGIYLASFSIAQLCGPTLGGLIAEQAGWRWVFWFNVPVGLLCLLWGAKTLPRTPKNTDRPPLDLRGNIIILVGLSAGLAALSQGTALGWTHPAVVGGLLATAILIPAFVLYERRLQAPLIDFTLFRQRPFGIGLLASFMNSISQSGIVLLMSLYFQAAMGYQPFTAGLLVLPIAVAALVASIGSGPLQRRISASTLTVLGNLVTLAALVVLLIGTSARSHWWVLLFGLALAGFGSGLFMPSNATALMRDLPDDRLGIANAMRLLLQTSGFVVGTAVILSIVTSALPPELRKYLLAGTISHVAPGSLEQLHTGYQHTLLTMIALGMCTATASLAARQSRPAELR